MHSQSQRAMVTGILMVGTLLALLAVPAASEAGVLWYSRFETQSGAAVTDGQAFSVTTGAIDNQAGTGGTAYNTDSAMKYLAYGQAGVPAMPSWLDPNGLAGGFAWSNPVPAADSTPRGVHTSVDSKTLSVDFTIEGCFNLGEELVPATTTNNMPRRLMTQRRSSTASRVSVGLGRMGDDNLGDNVLILYSHDGTTDVLTKGTTPIVQGEWHHFAVVVDLNDTSGLFDLSLYLDGRLEATQANATLAALSTSLYPIVLANYNASKTDNRFFRGLLDEFRISDQALSPQDFLMTPEPGALALLLLGGMGVFNRARRRTHHTAA